MEPVFTRGRIKIKFRNKGLWIFRGPYFFDYLKSFALKEAY